MGVGKIFKVLIVIVVCVIIGAMVINSIVPNATAGIIDAIESMIHKATGLSFDFNGNGKSGGAGTKEFHDTTDGGKTGDWKTNVEGFK